MIAEATDADFTVLTDQVRDALIQAGHLTPEAAVRIDESMRSTGRSFGSVALQLGLVSPGDLAIALEVARGARDGIIESAISKLSNNRNLPVAYYGTCKPGADLILANDPDTLYGERIRALRTELLLLNSGSRGGSMITLLSPCAGEGRSRLCAELAIAFSQLGRRTLLVDADLRRPSIHKLFLCDHSIGLGQALTLRSAPQLLKVENLPHLSVLVAGPTTHNPLELLSNGHFERQMADWRKKYEMVIIDTPPVTQFADGLAIASCVEQVLVVSRANSTPHKNMKEMLRRLATTQSRIVGAVINRF